MRLARFRLVDASYIFNIIGINEYCILKFGWMMNSDTTRGSPSWFD